MTLFIIGILLSLVIVVLIYQTISKRYNIIENMNKEGFDIGNNNILKRNKKIDDLMKLTKYNKTSINNELMAQNNPDIDNFPVLEKKQFIDQIKNAEVLDTSNSESNLENTNNINTESAVFNNEYNLVKKPMSTVDPSPLKDLIDRCKLVKSCNELDAINNGSGLEDFKCGYCANTGKYLVVNSKTLDDKGLLLDENKTMQTDACLKGNGIKDYGISLTNAMCNENKDFKVCDDADGGQLNESPSLKCEKLTGESEAKCGWCPISNKLVPMEKVNGKELPKYPNSQFNDQGGCTNLLENTTFVVPSNKCIEYIDNNPCVGTTSSTGPHNQKCVEQQWKTTGCPVKKIDGKTFAEYSSYWQTLPLSKDYISMKNHFHEITKEKLNSNIYEESRFAHQMCYGEDNITYNHDHSINREGFSSIDGVLKKINLNACDYSKYEPNTTCARNILEVLGCKSDKPDSAYKNIEENKDEWGKGVQPWVNKINRVKNKISLSKIYDEKKTAAEWCGTEIPPPPEPMKLGDIVVTQDDTHEGVVMETEGDRIRVMWVRHKNRNRYELDNTKDSDVRVQRYYFGWPDKKAEMSSFTDSEMTSDGWILKSLFNLYDVKRCTESGSCANCDYNVQRMRDLFPKPRDCVVGDWKVIQDCSDCVPFNSNKNFNDYKRIRERDILVKPFAGGEKCPSLKEVRKCKDVKPDFDYCSNNVSDAPLNQSGDDYEMVDDGPYFRDGDTYLKCPAKEHGATDCWSEGGQKKWCRNREPDAESPYKIWACNNCDECKGDSKAGGPWTPYRGPLRNIPNPVVCVGSVDVSAKRSKRAVQNYCNNYHMTLERNKMHTEKKGCSCKPYKAVNIKKNAGKKYRKKWVGFWPWERRKVDDKSRPYYTKWTGKCVIR